MNVVLDTNVFVSGIFFGGTPYKVLDAWRREKFTLVASIEILAEYQRIADELAERYAITDLDIWIELLGMFTKIVKPRRLQMQICEDPDDDKFIACALSVKSPIIVTGDKKLLKVHGTLGLEVLTPAQFIQRR
jgi:putative PIN family toxin of toxin-antitoxin system